MDLRRNAAFPELLTACALAAAMPGFAHAADGLTAAHAFTGFNIDTAHNNISLFLDNGTTIKPPKEQGQVAVSSPQLSKFGDNDAVGWLVEYDTCCQSYPVPETLIVYTVDGHKQVFRSDQMVWGWAFSSDHAHVVMKSGPTHGTDAGHYEMFDILSGKRTDEAFDTPDTNGQKDADLNKLPVWARPLEYN